MIFYGITKDFDLTDEQQYDTIGQFWDEMFTFNKRCDIIKLDKFAI